MASSSSSSTSQGSRKKDVWHLPPERRLKIQVNRKGQPIGPNSWKLSSSFGRVARMGNFISILDNSWKKVSETGKEDAWDYLNEHFQLPDTLKKYVMTSISRCWGNHKRDLRRKLDKAIKHSSYETIRATTRDGVQTSQWKEFVRRYFDKKENWNARTAKGRTSRNHLKENHTCGRKSYAQKREEMEEKDGCPITPVEFYRRTHTKKDESINEYSRDIVEKSLEVIANKTSQGHEKTAAMEEEALREVRGPEHSGRVRGEGRGVTKSSLAFLKMYDATTSYETQKQREELEGLKKAMEEKDKAIKEMQEKLQEKDTQFNTMQQQIQLLMQMQGLQR